MGRSTIVRNESEGVLEQYARALAELTRGRVELPPRWHAPAFARQLDLARAHLGPIRSRVLLASSFERESFRVGRRETEPDALVRDLQVSPVHVAYALRWLELGDGPDHPGRLRAAASDSNEGDAEMIPPSNRPNARAGRTRLLSPRARTRRQRAGQYPDASGYLDMSECPDMSDPVEPDRPGTLSGDARSAAAADSDASRWFG